MTETDQTSFTAMPGLPGVTLVRRSGRTPTKTRHMHRSLCVGAVLGGERVFVVDGSSTAIASGEVVVLPPGLVHACPDTGESEYLMATFLPNVLERLGFDVSAVRVPSPRVVDPLLYSAIVRLEEFARIPASFLEREGAVLDLLRCLSDVDVKVESAGPASGRVEAARRCLEARFTENVSLQSLASEAGLSPCRFNRIFSRQMGMPPHEYQGQLRVDEVKRLAAEGVPLAEAAVAAGFSDQSHMTRCFRKNMGITPGAYVKGLEKGYSH